MGTIVAALALLLVAVAATCFVLPALRPYSWPARIMLGENTRERVSSNRWRYIRAHLLLQAGGCCSMAAMFLVLVIAGGPGSISDAGIVLMLGCGMGGIILPIASYVVWRRSREA
jgi:hypothetical protein